MENGDLRVLRPDNEPIVLGNNWCFIWYHDIAVMWYSVVESILLIVQSLESAETGFSHRKLSFIGLPHSRSRHATLLATNGRSSGWKALRDDAKNSSLKDYIALCLLLVLLIDFSGVLTDEGNSVKVIIVVLSCFVALLIIVIGVLVLFLRRKRNAVPEITSGDAPRANSPDQNTRNDSSLDQHTSAQRFYKELSPSPQADKQPYAASQHGKASHGYYNVSFSREETQLDKYEVPLPSGVTPTYEEIN